MIAYSRNITGKIEKLIISVYMAMLIKPYIGTINKKLTRNKLVAFL